MKVSTSRFFRTENILNRFVSDKEIPINIKDCNLKVFSKDMPDQIGIYFSLNSDFSKFSIQIFWKQEDDIQHSIQLDYDSSFLFPYKKYGQGNDNNFSNINEEIIRECCEKYLSHPALHVHLKKYDNNENKIVDFIHNIRLNLASTNPFVVLHQIALQCVEILPDGDKIKEQEINRISKLIFNDIQNHSVSNNLFI